MLVDMTFLAWPGLRIWTALGMYDKDKVIFYLGRNLIILKTEAHDIF